MFLKILDKIFLCFVSIRKLAAQCCKWRKLKFIIFWISLKKVQNACLCGRGPSLYLFMDRITTESRNGVAILHVVVMTSINTLWALFILCTTNPRLYWWEESAVVKARHCWVDPTACCHILYQRYCFCPRWNNTYTSLTRPFPLQPPSWKHPNCFIIALIRVCIFRKQGSVSKQANNMKIGMARCHISTVYGIHNKMTKLHVFV